MGKAVMAAPVGTAGVWHPDWNAAVRTIEPFSNGTSDDSPRRFEILGGSLVNDGAAPHLT